MNWRILYGLRSYLRSSLWVVPFIAIPFELVITRMAHGLDAWLGWNFLGFAIPGAQALLQAIVTATLSFVVFTFGSLLVAIQVASSQLTPRIIATTLLRNDVVKYTVGLFIFTLMFALSAQNRMEKDVHQLVMLMAALLIILSFAAFLYLIDYASRLLRPISILARVCEYGLAVIEGIYPDPSRDDLWCLSIQRSVEQAPFSPEEKRKLAQLSKSLSSAAAIARALGFATTNAALDAFEVSDSAVLLIDRLGNVIRANQSAEKLLKGDAKISRGKIVTKDQSAGRAVERALYKLLGASESALAAPIPLPRDGQRPLLVYLLKLSSLSANALAECQAIAVLIDPDKRWVPTEMTLRASFGFTAAEARLAARVSSGAALDSVAESLGISKETGRNQLKSIFAKTGVHRQAELVAVVGSTANAARGTLDST